MLVRGAYGEEKQFPIEIPIKEDKEGLEKVLLSETQKAIEKIFSPPCSGDQKTKIISQEIVIFEEVAVAYIVI